MRDQTLILIPSPLVIPFSYHFLKRRLEKEFTLHIPTVPASALTFSKRFLWNENDYADWLFKYIKKNNIQKCFLLGHSNSGPIAIRFAELHPELVNGIILADTIGVEQRGYLQTLWGRVVDAFVEWKLTLWGFHHLLWNLIVHMPNFLYQIRASMRTDIFVKAKGLTVPVLILWGRRDHTIPLFLGEKLNRALPLSKLYISEEGSHDWLITHADESSRVIVDWSKSKVINYADEKTDSGTSHFSSSPGASHAPELKGHLRS